MEFDVTLHQTRERKRRQVYVVIPVYNTLADKIVELSIFFCLLIDVLIRPRMDLAGEWNYLSTKRKVLRMLINC